MNWDRNSRQKAHLLWETFCNDSDQILASEVAVLFFREGLHWSCDRLEMALLKRYPDELIPFDLETEQIMRSIPHPPSPRAYSTKNSPCDLLKSAKWSASDVHKLRRAFKQYDRDGGNTVSTAEIVQVLTNLGLKFNEDDISKELREVDEDGSGELDFIEFCQLSLRLQASQKAPKRRGSVFNVVAATELLAETDEEKFLKHEFEMRQLLISMSNFEEEIKTSKDEDNKRSSLQIESEVREDPIDRLMKCIQRVMMANRKAETQRKLQEFMLEFLLKKPRPENNLGIAASTEERYDWWSSYRCWYSQHQREALRNEKNIINDHLKRQRPLRVREMVELAGEDVGVLSPPAENQLMKVIGGGGVAAIRDIQKLRSMVEDVREDENVEKLIQSRKQEEVAMKNCLNGGWFKKKKAKELPQNIELIKNPEKDQRLAAEGFRKTSNTIPPNEPFGQRAMHAILKPAEYISNHVPPKVASTKALQRLSKKKLPFVHSYDSLKGFRQSPSIESDLGSWNSANNATRDQDDAVTQYYLDAGRGYVERPMLTVEKYVHEKVAKLNDDSVTKDPLFKKSISYPELWDKTSSYDQFIKKTYRESSHYMVRAWDQSSLASTRIPSSPSSDGGSVTNESPSHRPLHLTKKLPKDIKSPTVIERRDKFFYTTHVHDQLPRFISSDGNLKKGSNPGCLDNVLVSTAIALGNKDIIDFSNVDCQLDIILTSPHLHTIQTLKLCRTVFQGEPLFEDIAVRCPQLTTLDLSGSRFPQSWYASLTRSIEFFIRLHTLNISSVGLGVTGESTSIQLFRALTTLLNEGGMLHTLDISDNMVKEEGFKVLRELVTIDSQLREFYICDISTGVYFPNGVQYFLEGIRDTRLEGLYISNSNLTSSDVFILETAMFFHTGDLKIIDVSNNQLGVTGLESILRLAAEDEVLEVIRVDQFHDSNNDDIPYKPNDPSGPYCLKLENPFDRAKFARLLLQCEKWKMNPQEVFQQLKFNKRSFDIEKLYSKHNVKIKKNNARKRDVYYDFDYPKGELIFVFTGQIPLTGKSNMDALIGWQKARRCSVTLKRFVILVKIWRRLNGDREKCMLLEAISRSLLMKITHLKFFLGETPNHLQTFAITTLYPALEFLDRIAAMDLMCAKKPNGANIKEAADFRRKNRSVSQMNPDNPTGHYVFDMQLSTDYSCLEKLCVINQFQKSISMQTNRPDTSRHGNYENVRNMVCDREEIKCELSQWSLPPLGADISVTLDYVNPLRPAKSKKITNPRIFRRILEVVNSAEVELEEKCYAVNSIAHHLVLSMDQVYKFFYLLPAPEFVPEQAKKRKKRYKRTWSKTKCCDNIRGSYQIYSIRIKKTIINI